MLQCHVRVASHSRRHVHLMPRVHVPDVPAFEASRQRLVPRYSRDADQSGQMNVEYMYIAK